MSPTIATALVWLVAVIQLAIAVVEMFFWSVPRVHGRLGFNAAEAKKVAPIVANAGLYNSFLAAGLIWGVMSGAAGLHIEAFFLFCVVVAGVFGALTLKPTTLLLQTAPGALALAAVWMARF
jgi:putative membrane protein